MLEICHETITSEIKEADYLAVIADETSDVANVFQMVMVYRYIIKGKPVERFWGFIAPPKHDAQSLASCLLNELSRHNLLGTSHKLIAQTYDGASVMSGSSGGVQAIVKHTYPNAEYVHCHAHRLNLIMLNAASANRNVRVFFPLYKGFVHFSLPVLSVQECWMK